MNKEETKQETLYDAFLNCLLNKEFKTREDYIAFRGAEFGAKWQAERMYSLNEIKTAMKDGYGIKYFSEHKFLENLKQLKNKQDEQRRNN